MHKPKEPNWSWMPLASELTTDVTVMADPVVIHNHSMVMDEIHQFCFNSYHFMVN